MKVCASTCLLLLALVGVASAKANCGTIDGYLIDLDGTMYTPSGLVPGATEFYSWILKNKIPHVFLSNTGAKGPEGVQAKFMTAPWILTTPEDPVPLTSIRTASSALADYISDNVPAGSFLYIIQSVAKYGTTTDSCVLVLQRHIAHWGQYVWRTDLSNDEVHEWALRATKSPNSTYVISCADGQAVDQQDPVTGKNGYPNGWSFELLSTATILIQNGAQYINHAPDMHNMVLDPSPAKMMTVGPGAFSELLRAAAYPMSANAVTVGKGGNAGTKYMIEAALQLLKSQGGSGRPETTAMVGDTLDTDIRAANAAGTIGVLVLSGIHQSSDEKFFPNDKPTCVVDSVGDLVPEPGQLTSDLQSEAAALLDHLTSLPEKLFRQLESALLKVLPQ